MPPADDPGRPERPEPPDYKVYRSRPGLLSRLRKPDVGSLRDRMRRRQGAPGEPPEGGPARPRPAWRRVLKWVALAALAWILISFLAFAISAQIQKFKLADGITDVLGGNPFLAVNPQTILVLGTDVRPSGLAGPQSEVASQECVDAATAGDAPPAGCSYRADTILLVRAGGTTFRKLSIPRDTVAAIPGQATGPINAAYAEGGARLEVQTVEQFLGIDVDQVSLVDFNGFRDFINAIGGVKVDLDTPVCSEISGGAENGGFTLKLDAGEHTLDADQALTLARTRENTCGTGQFTGTDLERTKFQQDVLSGIKDRLTDPLRIPYNFIKGPIIGWEAPKAMVSSMGALTMPQLVLSTAIGGDSGTDVLRPSSLSPLTVPVAECQRAVHAFLGHDPPRAPQCSPSG